MIISVFTPHGGCPERCHFCDQSVSGGAPVAAREVALQIERHLATSSTGKASEIAFYGGTFTAMPRDRQLGYLEMARPYLENGRIEGVRVSTRPDALDEDWLVHLRDRYRLGTVELGAQSFESEALRRMGRTHSVESIEQALQLLKKLGLRSSLHLLLGCPGESEHADTLALEWLGRIRPDCVRLHPLLVLAGTELEREWRANEYVPLELEAAVERAATLTCELERLGVQVLRLGLQPNELLGARVVAGAYHPSFGDLVRGRILRRMAERALLERLTLPGAQIELRVSEVSSGSLRGKDSVNLSWLKTRFDLSDIGVRVVKGQPNGTVEIGFCDSDRTAQRR